MSKRGVVLLSICANVILAFSIAHLAKTKFSRAPEKISVLTTFVTNIAPPEISSEMPLTETNSVPAAFHWSAIESEDYPAYIANLRRANCPEKTIRNILIPDIEALYDKRRREELITSPTNFWISGRARAALSRERAEKTRALDGEQSALVKQLLEIDWVKSDQRHSFGRNFEDIGLPYLMTASLSIEKTRELFDLTQKYESRAQQIQAEVNDILLPEDEIRLKKLNLRLKEEMRHLMSPQEFDEFNLRATAIGNFDLVEHLKTSDLVLSPDEFKKICQLTTGGRDFLNDMNLSFEDEEEPSPQQVKEAEAAIKSVLGGARYTMFQEATDDNFRSAKQFVEAQHLPKQTSRVLFEVQQAAEDQAAQIRADQSLNTVERKSALREIRASTEAALGGMFDPKIWQAYQDQQGKDWLENISKKSK